MSGSAGQTTGALGTLLRLDPPLDPSSDEGRSLLRRELLEPRYNDQNLLDRLLNAVLRRIDGGINAASNIGALSTFAAMVVLLALVLALGWLASRARRSTTADAAATRAVLTDEIVTADQLRRRSELALAQGQFEDAVVEAFRALAVRQVERGRLEDSPGTTAHEVSLVLTREYPHQRVRMILSANLFDAVLYGERSATREQALDVLALHDEMAGVR